MAHTSLQQMQAYAAWWQITSSGTSYTSEGLPWCPLCQWLLFHFFRQQRFMKFLCVSLYFWVKTSLLLVFKRALLSVRNVTLEELFLSAKQWSWTVVVLKNLSLQSRVWKTDYLMPWAALRCCSWAGKEIYMFIYVYKKNFPLRITDF